MLSFSELIEIGNASVPFRRLYDMFNLTYNHADGTTQCKCPFHGEDKHPSARIYEDTNSWFCWTCGFAKTPIFFLKSMLDQPLTDSVVEFYKYFRKDIINANPELAGESFSADDIKLAYLRHLGDNSGILATQRKLSGIFLTKRDDLEVVLPTIVAGMDQSLIYKATRDLWRRNYNNPNFTRLYYEFTNHLDLTRSPEAPIVVCNNFNFFLANLQRSFKNFLEDPAATPRIKNVL